MTHSRYLNKESTRCGLLALVSLRGFSQVLLNDSILLMDFDLFRNSVHLPSNYDLIISDHYTFIYIFEDQILFMLLKKIIISFMQLFLLFLDLHFISLLLRLLGFPYLLCPPRPAKFSYISSGNFKCGFSIIHLTDFLDMKFPIIHFHT